MKAFRGIQALPPDDPDSFYCIAGFHGTPYRPPGKGDDPEKWWGGYCHHEDVLFPMWHRVYLLRLENALRKVDGCENVRIPFWDELLAYQPSPLPGPPPAHVPVILTSPEFEGGPNPLYSYRLQRGFGPFGKGERYVKPAGYETVRYPLSGLVGTWEDAEASMLHNANFPTQEGRVEVLNGNVANWLSGVQIPDDDNKPPTPRPTDVTSVYERFKKCLEAPNYTVFSNTRSQSHYNTNLSSADTIVVSLESPHNSIHLAVGGFYQKGAYNASPIRGANGDLGANEVAGFDPIFFLHHGFIDYAFWTWQKKHKRTAVGSITIDAHYPGAKTNVGLPVPPGAPPMPDGTSLTLDTPLYPFQKPDGTTYFASKDLVDIKNQLGYDYDRGSLDNALLGQLYGIPPREVPIMQKISGINRSDYFGSFVVRLYGYSSKRKDELVEVGREAVLSRLKLSDCANCQNSLEQEFFIPVHQDLVPLLEKDESDDTNFRTVVGIHTYDREEFPAGKDKVPLVVKM